MQKTAITSAVLVGVVALGFWVWKHPITDIQSGTSITFDGLFETAPSTTTADVSTEPNAALPKTAFTHLYSENVYGFSFLHPDGYSVKSTPNADGAGNTILIQNDTTKKGVQILVTPYDDADTTITAKKIAQDIPDMKVLNPQVVQVGAGKGLAFISDNGAFDGNSREVWFVFRKNLYQISTYAAYDDFVGALLDTWKFN